MANVIRIGGGSAGGSTVTLPPMITNLKAVGSNATITVTFTNPVSEALAGVMVVYNDNHIPTKPSDGKKIDAGLTQQAVITGLQNGTEYFIRVYPYNEKKQYQTLIDGATTSATPNIGPAQVTNFQVTGSGASPVLTWTNPADDPLYYQTVVVQKVGSAPTSITDGTEIYRGTGTTVTASNLVRLEEYYWAVFTIDEAGSHRSPVVSEMYSYDFPAEPTEYSTCAEITATQEYVIPENGYFRIDAIGKSGDGGDESRHSGYRVVVSGGGGTGGHSRSEIVAYAGDIININIGGRVTISSNDIENLNMVANAGSAGRTPTSYTVSGTGGEGGSATGGNKLNEKGVRGNDGTTKVIDPGDSAYGGTGGSKRIKINETTTFVTTGGRGKGMRLASSGDMTSGWSSISRTTGTAAKVFISRGNTNVPSPSAASMLSLTPRNASIEASWTNSEDPESVGTLLVSNPTHEPQDITDGTAVDVAEATSYTVTDLPNDKPTYISLFSYNADKSKYSAAKSDVEIPREVTWADMVEEAQQEAKEATDKAAVAEEQAKQAKQANEMLQAKTEELAQTSAELTEKQVMVDSATATFNALIASDIQNDTKVISDNMILDNAEMLSKPWEVGTPNEVGDIVWYMIGDVKQYYKVVQPTENADPNHTPNIVPAVFVAINKTNAGTIDDPIPAVRGMEYEYGKYYLDNEDGKIYICKRGEETGTIVLQYLPHELIGHYFELATLTE